MSPVSGDAEIQDVRYTRYRGERRGRLPAWARWRAGLLRSLGAARLEGKAVDHAHGARARARSSSSACALFADRPAST
jgi:hypothetical protein